MPAKHFSEPWTVTKANDHGVEIENDRGDMVYFEEFDDSDLDSFKGAAADRAYRIAACVNALAGIDDPAATLAECRVVLHGIAQEEDDLAALAMSDNAEKRHKTTAKRIRALLAKLGAGK